MRLYPTGVAVLFMLGGLAAQDAKVSVAKAECDALIAEVTAATKVNRAAMQELQKTEEFVEARKARDNEKIRAIMAKVTPVDNEGFTKRFQAAAEKYGSTDDAVYFLTWIAHNTMDKDAGRAAVEALTTTHVESPRLMEFVEKGMYSMRHYADPTQLLVPLERVVDDNKSALVRAHAMYAMASTLRRDRNAADSVKARADDLTAQAAKLAEGTDLADTIHAPVFEQERLQIGMEVPDIEGVDLDGVAFKLSDYRGKVVVLDFWGDW